MQNNPFFLGFKHDWRQACAVSIALAAGMFPHTATSAALHSLTVFFRSHCRRSALPGATLPGAQCTWQCTPTRPGRRQLCRVLEKTKNAAGGTMQCAWWFTSRRGEPSGRPQ